MSMMTSSISAIMCKLADDVERPHEHAAREQDPIVTATWDQLGEIVELLGETVDDAQQLDRLEVRNRRFTVRPTFLAEQ